ncbi:uncharacterized protein LOC110977145 isoform X2 [Acanthaster planci]|uniref:Uncharacterized protein LOC110977145 isoform X2 n=1 Tax=Acanthaster planci TaxID=133434 RepID=A0A8B7Y0K6_ACAPL|nr:uncharacterized protein LOC110977145 isoform X2 [Acanthaster planci]
MKVLVFHLSGTVYFICQFYPTQEVTRGVSPHKPGGLRSKMCRESQQQSTTNFPPIAEYSRLTSPPAQRRSLHDGRTRREPHRPITGAPNSRPRSNSDQSLGDIWSSSRRSICSSNGRSSLSLSSGDASTVASTEKLCRRRKLSPRRVVNRPVTPFPAEEIPHAPVGEAQVERRVPAPSPPRTNPSKPHPSYHAPGRTRFSLSQKHQPIDEDPCPGKIATSRPVRRNTGDSTERTPHPPSQQHKEVDATKASERRRRKSMPEIYQRPKGEARKTDAGSKKTEAQVLGEIMDSVTRERIVSWLSEIAYAKEEDQGILQDALSCIDEE